tara:strand:+ start:1969 stop:2328 length:360 start_codon:yes stop_codon:yes gene_type:complete
MSRFNYLESEVRPWGRYFVLHDEANYKIKRIEVETGKRLSYQYHHKRSEMWTIIEGNAKITLDDKTHILKPGESIKIPRKSKHRVENVGHSSLVFIEIQTGDYFGEDDIVRIEDDFNRK